jgi:hypothetical protein
MSGRSAMLEIDNEWREFARGTAKCRRRVSEGAARRFDGRMVFVPEGQHDRSQARSAWESVPPKNRPVGYGMIGRFLVDCAPCSVSAFLFETSSLQSSNRCAHLRESDRTLRDGSFG